MSRQEHNAKKYISGINWAMNNLDKSDIIVASTGVLSRELFELRKRILFLYTVKLHFMKMVTCYFIEIDIHLTRLIF